MIARPSTHNLPPWFPGLLLLGVLSLPSSRAYLEASMVLHQAVQLPLLALSGYLLGRSLSPDGRSRLAWFDPAGLTGLLCMLSAGLFWMLPRYLDAAVSEPQWDAVKFATVPLLIGVPLAVSWPRVHPILKGVVKAELFVTLLRLAWLYLDSPVRLCNNYLLGEQQALARVLLAATCIWGAWVVLRFFFGRHGRCPDGSAIGAASPRAPSTD